LKKSKESLPLFNEPFPQKLKLNIKENSFFQTRGGWVAKVVYIYVDSNRCIAIHNPNTPYESSPIIHENDSGFAIPAFSIGEPPTYSGHPADFVKEVQIN
jgi:hypothetical protein